jgi:hypothetical protein
MIVGTPLVQTEQDRSVGIDDLTEIVVGRSRSRQAEQRLVPRKAERDVSDADDRPQARAPRVLRQSINAKGRQKATEKEPHGLCYDTLTRIYSRKRRFCPAPEIAKAGISSAALTMSSENGFVLARALFPRGRHN